MFGWNLNRKIPPTLLLLTMYVPHKPSNRSLKSTLKPNLVLSDSYPKTSTIIIKCTQTHVKVRFLYINSLKEMNIVWPHHICDLKKITNILPRAPTVWFCVHQLYTHGLVKAIWLRKASQPHSFSAEARRVASVANQYQYQSSMEFLKKHMKRQEILGRGRMWIDRNNQMNSYSKWFI